MTGRIALRRLIATVGLALMVPIGVQLVTGTLTPADAATRAATVFVAVWVGRMLASLAPGNPPIVIEASNVDGGT